MNRASFTDDHEKDISLIDLNLKTVSSYLSAFQSENVLINPEKVRNFLLTNISVFGKLTKLVSLALTEYQNLIENISLRILADESGKQELILVEFILSEEVDVDYSIEIDDDFKHKNPNLSNNLINFDFV